MLATVFALGLAACGGDDEDDSGASGYGAGTKTEQADTTATETTATETTGTPTGGEAEDGGAKPPSTSPEEQEGGAGDEVPASSQALVTGNGGKLSPATVRVPPFIAIRVQLRSADGVEYELSGGGKTVKAGGEIESAGTTFDGLRTGERLVLSGPQGKVTIVANAEPGP
jgi:cytoskeletal protein RodZ